MNASWNSEPLPEGNKTMKRVLLLHLLLTLNLVAMGDARCCGVPLEPLFGEDLTLHLQSHTPTPPIPVISDLAAAQAIMTAALINACDGDTKMVFSTEDRNTQEVTPASIAPTDLNTGPMRKKRIYSAAELQRNRDLKRAEKALNRSRQDKLVEWQLGSWHNKRFVCPSIMHDLELMSLVHTKKFRAKMKLIKKLYDEELAKRMATQDKPEPEVE